MVISILLKPTFWQISICSQSLVNLLQQSDKDINITFKVIEKYRYGLWKIISKHLKYEWIAKQQNFLDFFAAIKNKQTKK